MCQRLRCARGVGDILLRVVELKLRTQACHTATRSSYRVEQWVAYRCCLWIIKINNYIYSRLNNFTLLLALEKVQKKTTELLLSLKHLSYPDRLKACNLTTLHYRQIREDWIETYKIVSGKYDSTTAPTLLMSDTRITRGNNLRLQKFRCKYDVRKFYFTNRDCSFCSFA